MIDNGHLPELGAEVAAPRRLHLAGQGAGLVDRRQELDSVFLGDLDEDTPGGSKRKARGVHHEGHADAGLGGERAAAAYTLFKTAKLNSVDPQAWLT